LLRHIVFLEFKDDVSESRCSEIMESIGALKNVTDSIIVLDYETV